jgi:cold shock CspA family protein
MNGTVKWFSAEKGYGFIHAADGLDYYVKAGSFAPGTSPTSGDVVTFTPTRGPMGPKATQVVVTEHRPQPSRSIPEAVARWVITDHYGFANLKTLPGFGFWGNLKFIAIQIVLKLLGILLTGIVVFLLIAYGIPYFLSG